MTTTCVLCKTTECIPYARDMRDYITGAPFAIECCTRCGLAFTIPQPARMDPFYPQRYRRFGRVARFVLQAFYNRRARAWVRALGAPGIALEIGSGAGWMLRALRRCGWRVIGNERTAQSSLAALAKEGLPSFVGDLQALRESAQFDLIILFQVLEHLSDPVEVLRCCSRLLKPGGTLLVAVPNLASWQARLCGPFWFHLDVPRHLFHFTPHSLNRALEDVGLTVGAVRYSSPEHDPYGWLQSAQNWMGFRQNQLTRMLMGIDRWGSSCASSLGVLIVSALLLPPSLLLSALSWGARAGALMEVSAVKPLVTGSCPRPAGDTVIRT